VDPALLDAIPLAAYVALDDERRSLRYVSAGIEALVGVPASELAAVEACLDALVHPEDRARVRSEVAGVCNPGDALRSEYRLLGRDGRTVWVRDQAVVGVDDRGSRVLRGVLLDVTDEHLTQRQLDGSDARLRLLTGQLPAVVWTSDARLALTSLAGRGLAVVAADAAGFPGPAVVPELERALAGESVSFPLSFGGRQFEATAQALLDDRGAPVGVIGVALDVTERRAAEAALVEREAQLREAQRLEALGRLAGGVAHDFNNLLTTISGNAKLMLEEIPAGDPLREEAESIVRTSSRAEALVDQLFAFARSGELAVEEVDVNSVVHDLEPLLHQLVPTGTTLVVSPDPTIGPALVDPARLEQVIVNLVVNARDAMPDGGTLRLGTSATVDSVASPGEPGCREVVVTVSDTGIGMDPETRARIFEPFFTTKEPGRGTGLGLATVHRIVEQSGGRIVVESQLGLGTTFRVVLPGSPADRPGASS